MYPGRSDLTTCASIFLIVNIGNIILNRRQIYLIWWKKQISEYYLQHPTVVVKILSPYMNGDMNP